MKASTMPVKPNELTNEMAAKALKCETAGSRY